jgi:hypothetical protein
MTKDAKSPIAADARSRKSQPLSAFRKTIAKTIAMGNVAKATYLGFVVRDSKYNSNATTSSSIMILMSISSINLCYLLLICVARLLIRSGYGGRMC